MKFKNLDGWTSDKTIERDLLNGLSRLQRTFVLEKIMGRNDKDAALAAEYSLSMAENTKRKIWKQVRAEFQQLSCTASPQDAARKTRSQRERCWTLYVKRENGAKTLNLAVLLGEPQRKTGRVTKKGRVETLPNRCTVHVRCSVRAAKPLWGSRLDASDAFSCERSQVLGWPSIGLSMEGMGA